jgi:hypothetical protein
VGASQRSVSQPNAKGKDARAINITSSWGVYIVHMTISDGGRSLEAGFIATDDWMIGLRHVDSGSWSSRARIGKAEQSMAVKRSVSSG